MSSIAPERDERRTGAVGAAGQLRRVVGAEWIKARSLSSTWSALGATAFIMVVIGVIISSGVAGAEAGAPGFEPLAQAFSGVPMSQVALGVLGALAVTTEYSSRSMVTTLAAVPQRGLLLAAKALQLVALTAPVALLATAGAAAASLPILRGRGLNLELTGPGVPRAILGTAVVLVLTGLLGLAIGALLRSTVAAVIVITVVMFLVPVLVGLVPAVRDGVGPWLPSQAGAAVLQLHDRSDYLSPAAGLAVTAGYTAAALAAAAVALRRRDA
jgi:hypothetical protein